MCRGDQSSLFALSDHATVGTVFLAAINRPSASPPSTDHHLQPSPSTLPTSSSPEKENPSSNRLGTPLSRGVENPSALQPTTEYRVICQLNS